MTQSSDSAALRPASPATLAMLRLVLATKILGTILFFCVPMLFLGEDDLRKLYGFGATPLLAARLIGGAYAALIVGYAQGWIESGQGRFPGWVVAMGLVSNGGGVLLAVVAIVTRDIELAALRPFGYAAIAFAASITLGLTACLLLHRRRMRI